MAQRKIIHIDMDAFYASVEQRDRPDLRGQPVVVGGSPQSRGVVCAASYEARRFGVRSAMSCARAHRLCPQAHFVPPDFQRYKQASRHMHTIFHDYTDLVEPLSLDEAFLDVTVNKKGLPSATWIAEEIRARIRSEQQLTASAGVGPNKFIAKIASEVNKPDGICVVRPEMVVGFLRPLPLRAVPGIGPKAERRLQRHLLRSIGDLQDLDDEQRKRIFGDHAGYFQRIAFGLDERPVQAHGERKSIGIEHTYAEDLHDPAAVPVRLAELVEGLWPRLERAGLRGSTLTLKVKYADFRQITRSRSRRDPYDNRRLILDTARQLFDEQVSHDRPIRLLGLLPAARRQLVLPFMDG
jgi:DNA polymerase-4